MIGSTYVAGVADGKDPDGRDQYKITGHTFNEGETFTLYDSANSTGWVEDINPYSFGDTTGAGANTATYLTKGADSYTVVSTFTADVYIKIAWENNDVYFGLSA